MFNLMNMEWRVSLLLNLLYSINILTQKRYNNRIIPIIRSEVNYFN